jgi:hypothetical protein
MRIHHPIRGSPALRRWRRTITGASVLAALLAGCRSGGSVLGPGDALIGHWMAEPTAFDASADQAILKEPCSEADFGPLTIEADGGIHAVSVRYLIHGNIKHFPDEQLSLSGRLTSEGHLVLTLLPLSDSLPTVDPLYLDLAPGKLGVVPFCAAAVPD